MTWLCGEFFYFYENEKIVCSDLHVLTFPTVPLAPPPVMAFSAAAVSWDRECRGWVGLLLPLNPAARARTLTPPTPPLLLLLAVEEGGRWLLLLLLLLVVS